MDFIITIGICSIILLIAIILFVYNYLYLRKQRKLSQTVQQLKKECEDAIKKKIQEEEYSKKTKKYILNLTSQKEETENLIQEKYKQLKLLEDTCTIQKNQIEQIITNYQNVAKNSYEKWFETLEQQYEKQEQKYDNSLALLEERSKDQQKIYEEKEKELQNHIQTIQQDILKIEQTRAALIEAQRKEREIKEKLSFYCVSITDSEKTDIRVLERIKPELKAPRILSMLIWSTYYQKPMTTLCNNVLGINTVCGIYKITNQKDNCCYIGQAVDVAKRWKDHAKCGLGIDTPANNKLYKAIKEDGLENFSFELLEQCKKEELNEKEKYYINLYKSKDYGYNSSVGNGKN